MKLGFGYFIKWFDYFVLLPLFSLMPKRVAYWYGRWRGSYRYRKRKFARQAMREGIRAFYGGQLAEAEIDRIIRESFQVWACEELETYFFPRLTRRSVRKLISLGGLNNLDEGLSRGKGVLLFSGHIGSFMSFFVALGLHGYKVNIVARSLDEDNPLHPVVRKYAKRKHAWVEEILQRKMIVTGRGNYGLMLEALRRNEIVAILIDTPPDLVKRKEEVKFFGKAALFSDGIVRLARDSEAALVSFCIYRSQDWIHQVAEIAEPFHLTGDDRADLQRCVSTVEDYIRRHPSHWSAWECALTYWAENFIRARPEHMLKKAAEQA